MSFKTLCVASLVFASAYAIDICEYWDQIGKLHEHPECARGMPIIEVAERITTTEAPIRIGFCSSSVALLQCTADQVTCPHSGQICLQSDGHKCCQIITAGIPASEINSKTGKCPKPLGISVLQDTAIGCWMDSNCPGIQKCCVEPNPVTNSATRICRDPEGISDKLAGSSICNLPLAVGGCTAPGIRFYYDASVGECKQFMYSGCGGNANNFQSEHSCITTCSKSGIRATPQCPADANAGLNCLFAHADACRADHDCLGRENTPQPSCCLTTCGYKICYQY